MKIEDIKNAKPNEVVRDKDDRNSVPGLHLRVSPSGRKTFMLYYRTKAGKERRPKIGHLGEITLAEARKRAQRILDQVAIGNDPQGEWAEARGETTVKELFDLVLEKHWKAARYETSGHRYIVELNWKNHLLPAFGAMRLSEVTADMIDAWHAKFREKPYAGNRSLETLSTMFNYAERLNLRPLGSNPCRVIEAHTERKRKRYATPEELRALTTIMDREAEARPAAVAFLYILLLTGSRPRLIERAHWSQLRTFKKDGFVFGELTLAGKATEDTGEDDVVILPPQAMEVLNRLPKTTGTITGIKHPKNFWARIRKEAGIENLRARDLRRTFATIANSAGVPMNTISELLNHKSSQTTKIYAKLFDDVRVDAAGKVAREIDVILGRKES